MIFGTKKETIAMSVNDILGHVEQTKTVVIKDGFGKTVTDRYALVDKGQFYAILHVAKNGEDLGNGEGGYPTPHIGKEAYIRRVWRG